MKQAGIRTLVDVAERSVGVGQLVGAMLSRRHQASWPVSLALTVLEVRRALPDCALNNRDLAEMVTIHAIARGCNVVFDMDLLGED